MSVREFGATLAYAVKYWLIGDSWEFAWSYSKALVVGFKKPDAY